MFNRLANFITAFTGSSKAFKISIVLVLGWLFSGPFFHFDDSWQLVANTGTTLITFIMTFIIQYDQNKHTKALHLKLDELIKAIDKADNNLRGIEKLSESEIEQLKNNT